MLYDASARRQFTISHGKSQQAFPVAPHSNHLRRNSSAPDFSNERSDAVGTPEREAVVRTACSLVGKVNYFWGGKSLVIGWDVRWGELRQVTAAGSSTTGTYRPYGLGCSGVMTTLLYPLAQ